MGKSLIAIAKARDAANLQGDHDHDHDRGHDHDHGQADQAPGRQGNDLNWGADPALLEHADERTATGRHNWCTGRNWSPGEPIPAPIVFTPPVRSRSRGRWDGDGM